MPKEKKKNEGRQNKRQQEPAQADGTICVSINKKEKTQQLAEGKEINKRDKPGRKKLLKYKKHA
ncbi:hypothetical protein RGU39_23365 [Bacillus wiedmannii]|uniref:hypothetical protein n=1 Tax=Bacillus wiedmannii TaxID=1890302 RepID=UPI002852F79D|nr:hypothetical protein [Bacillus wiedmannii]MDR4943452.1 hypothetical protein [Bacillus wiedmannii]